MKSFQEQLKNIKETLQRENSKPSQISVKVTKRNKNKKKITKVKNSKVYPVLKDSTKCPHCNCRLKKTNLNKHIRKAHSSKAIKDQNITENIINKPKLSVKSKQAFLARINQGRYDFRKELLILMKNSERRMEQEILKAVKQRLKFVSPETYRRLVGPLVIRDPLGSKHCYCAIPTSIEEIANDILSTALSRDSLLCDACWKIDICYAWGIYGAYGQKIISTEIWTRLCHERGDTKFSTY